MSADAPPSPAPTPPPVVRRKSDRGRIYLVAAVVAVAAIVVGIGAGTSWYGLKTSSSSTGCPTGVTLQGNGASFPAALVSQWTTNFHTSSGNIVNYPNNGAVLGITYLTEKSTDFAITDEGLTSAEATNLTNAVGTVLTLPVTGGSVALVYNATALGYSGPVNLTANELVGIYLGKITTWAGLASNNAGLGKIATGLSPVHRADGAGMTYVLTNYLSDQNKTWRTTTGLGTSTDPAWWTNVTAAIGATGNSAVLKDVKKTPGAIGYTDLYDAEEAASAGVAIAAIVNSHGTAVAPTWADTASAISDVYAAIGSSLPSATGDWSSVSWVNASGPGDYPLSTLVYMMVPQNPAKGHTASLTDATALREWIQWVATTGQKYNTTQFPYVSPPTPLLTQDLSALSGMMFNNQPIPSCS
ncbi:MAG TPA: substrate-binding domain-containing protein [Thermoplasmata archaeon]|nr:substrate-binding domain-containing protein [Thermoplasmata archaeon]